MSTEQPPDRRAPHLFELVAELVAVKGSLHQVVQALKAVREAQALQPQQLQAPAGRQRSSASAAKTLGWAGAGCGGGAPCNAMNAVHLSAAEHVVQA